LEIFEEALEQHTSFEQPLETVEPLVFSLNRIVEQLCSRLRLVQRVASGMHLELQLENGASHRHRFTVPAPNREEAVLLRILQTHLETLQFDAAVTGVRLRLDASLPDARQLALFESPLRDPNRFGETLGRLRALAGNEAVGVPLLAEGHRSDVFDLGDPLERFGAPILGEPLFPNGAWQTHGTAVGLPLRRFRPPVQACVHLLMHQPKHVMTKEWEAPVLECRGPYRKCGDWWAEQAWSHEEWDVRLGGRAAGMYRLARSLPPCSPPLRSPGSAETWWMEGCYDGAWWPSPGNPC
jgi:protein ImuB